MKYQGAKIVGANLAIPPLAYKKNDKPLYFVAVNNENATSVWFNGLKQFNFDWKNDGSIPSTLPKNIYNLTPKKRWVIKTQSRNSKQKLTVKTPLKKTTCDNVVL